ncbi:UDP-N-acetylmuramoyl-tripeptide--D-alanyl-D-alanine ligase [Rosenbergiella nectarea]|uniref:UDP-N-acetylmuramoyl-tripeptide--D-alanyl-D-alanine ligase n=1 Tax=Rosenbergiella nectarea TaxID=988801 RepID=A0A1H9E0W4_9GAMM|nr:UDP-N-acetylmuramoyl-tripeptide--D-alanyl-D-alanine ligase [Rosenbergiella nectarea]SEQ19419.1 UDP-N-acetylmuramoyl-tripeptide--D-alanyl-D-alanine ligase [Rosenbergiella nectarea]
MIPITSEQLALITAGEQVGKDVTLNHITTDTREVVEGSLFVALIGERFDAHQFAAQAINAGARALLVSHRLEVSVTQIVVEDTRIAFGKIGAWVREQVPAKVVGLTGSSGKTSVKEMTAAILKQCGETLYTAGNLNNDFGVPMTLLRLTPEHRFAVIEMGANHQGEIAYTTHLVKPEVALVNNLAAAHLEGFGSIEGVAKAKGEIFQGLPPQGIAILNAQSNDRDKWQPVLADKRVVTFSAAEQGRDDYYATDIKVMGEGTAFRLHTPHGACEVILPLPGQHNIANALAAAALSQSVGAPLEAIKQGLATLTAVPGRLFPIKLSESVLLLDDSYNANVGSMTAAAQVLASMPGYRIMIAGDMGELGNDTESCHRKVGKALHQAGVDKVLTVGQYSQWIAQESQVGEIFASKSALAERARELIQEHQVVTLLVKGSRSAAMEEIVMTLQEKDAC